LAVGEPPGGGGGQQCGDDADVAQARLSGGEHLRRRRQHGGHDSAVHPDPLTGLLGADDPAAGFEPVTVEQVGQCAGGVLVAALREAAAALQGGRRGDGQVLQLAGEAFADGEHRQQFAICGQA
jgi:hypothetical protein